MRRRDSHPFPQHKSWTHGPLSERGGRSIELTSRTMGTQQCEYFAPLRPRWPERMRTADEDEGHPFCVTSHNGCPNQGYVREEATPPNRLRCCITRCRLRRVQRIRVIHCNRHTWTICQGIGLVSRPFKQSTRKKKQTVNGYPIGFPWAIGLQNIN